MSERIDEIARRTAFFILPEHLHIGDDWQHACPAHPFYLGPKMRCVCDLVRQRELVADIVKGALEEYGSIVRSAHETASNS